MLTIQKTNELLPIIQTLFIGIWALAIGVIVWKGIR
jgi:hypothetical protein